MKGLPKIITHNAKLRAGNTIFACCALFLLVCLINTGITLAWYNTDVNVPTSATVAFWPFGVTSNDTSVPNSQLKGTELFVDYTGQSNDFQFVVDGKTFNYTPLPDSWKTDEQDSTLRLGFFVPRTIFADVTSGTYEVKVRASSPNFESHFFIQEGVFLNGTGDFADPYLLYTATDFSFLEKENFNKLAYRLEDNITLSTNVGEFGGSLDGNNNKITYTRVFDGAATSSYGIFETIATTGRVHNLNILINIEHVANALVENGLGGLANINNGVIENISGKGRLYTQRLVNVGGIVGINNNLVTKSSFSPNLDTDTIVGYDYGTVGGYAIGGIVGLNDGIVSNCTNSIAITAYSSVGAIVGQNGSASTAIDTVYVENCYNTGTIYTNSQSTQSGVVGTSWVVSEHGSVRNCYTTVGTIVDANANSSDNGILINNSLYGNTAIRWSANSDARVENTHEYASTILLDRFNTLGTSFALRGIDTVILDWEATTDLVDVSFAQAANEGFSAAYDVDFKAEVGATPNLVLPYLNRYYERDITINSDTTLKDIAESYPLTITETTTIAVNNIRGYYEIYVDYSNISGWYLGNLTDFSLYFWIDGVGSSTANWDDMIPNLTSAGTHYLQYNYDKSVVIDETEVAYKNRLYSSPTGFIVFFKGGSSDTRQTTDIKSDFQVGKTYKFTLQNSTTWEGGKDKVNWKLATI